MTNTSELTFKPISLDITAIRHGLGWAQSWTTGPVLCVINDETLRLVVVDQEHFLACWSLPLPGVQQTHFFLIPSFVSKTLAGQPAFNADALQFMVKKTVAGIILQEGKQEFRLQWRWDPDSFKAPRAFSSMLRPPADVMQTSYVAIADIVHLAIANLGSMPIDESISFDDAAIQIDFTPGQFNVDGTPLAASGNYRYFFKPRLVMRGMEVARGKNLGFSMQYHNEAQDSILYFVTEREGWKVHCAILSAHMTADNAPSTTLTVRETRPPMSDGAWIAPRSPG